MFASLTAGSTRSALSSTATGSCRNCRATRIAVFNMPINWPAARPVSGNVSDVGEQRSVALHGIDQVAAHFCAGNGFPVDLEAVNLKRKCRHQSRLYAVCEGKFGLHADGREAFGPDEIDEQPIPEDRAHQDADGVEDDSTVQSPPSPATRTNERRFEPPATGRPPSISRRTGARRIRFMRAANTAVPSVPT